MANGCLRKRERVKKRAAKESVLDSNQLYIQLIKTYFKHERGCFEISMAEKCYLLSWFVFLSVLRKKNSDRHSERGSERERKKCQR